eukprot:scaffold82_cov111-Cylindrotheca_fusiformis.AAC.3
MVRASIDDSAPSRGGNQKKADAIDEEKVVHSNEKDTKGPRLRYADEEHVLDSSNGYNGAFPGAINVPGRGNDAGDSNEKDTKGPRLRYADEEHVLDSSTGYNGAFPGAINVPGRGDDAGDSNEKDTKGPRLRYADEEHVLDSSTGYNGAFPRAINVPGRGNDAGDSNEKDTKGPRLRYADEEHVLDSSTWYNGAFPRAINVPGRGNDAATSAIIDESSSGVVVAAEVAPDRELLVEEAYRKGALDRERALQEAEALRRTGEVAVAVPDDDSSANGKKRRTVMCLVGLVVVIAVGLLIGFLVQGKDGDGTSAVGTSTVVPTSPPSAFSDLLPPLEESLQFPLSLCQGDCDSDVDCQDGLECFQRTGGMDVPGCSGGQQDLSGTDYCIMIEEVDPILEESTEFPLGVCQGDCDSNADCKAGLICFQRNEGEEVPGCFGGADDFSRNDYCINQGHFMERFGERLVGSPDDNFGSSVALSSDGMTMAVGAVDVGSTGYVNIYESVEESSWDLVATIVGDNIGDMFGHSVELAGDGRTIAIGYVLGFPVACGYLYYSARVRVLGASLANKTIWNLIGEDISGE